MYRLLRMIALVTSILFTGTILSWIFLDFQDMSPRMVSSPDRARTLPSKEAVFPPMAQQDTQETVNPPSTVRNDLVFTRDLPKPDEAFSAFQRGYYLTAHELAMPLAINGDSSAQTLLGELYAHGLGVAQNFSQAAKWYAEAAETGDPEAMFALGWLHMHGNGIRKDILKGRELFEKASATGHAAAQYNLGLLLIEGKLYPRDLQRAEAMFRLAAEQGHVQAQYDLGCLLQESSPDKDRVQEAVEWFHRAAQGGSIDAAMDYGILLFNGRGVQKDEAEGIRWISHAAHAGNPVAQNRMAHLHAYGHRVPLNLIEAAKWHILARKQGKEDAALEKVLQNLPPEQQRAAEYAAQRWTPQGRFGLIESEAFRHPASASRFAKGRTE